MNGQAATRPRALSRGARGVYPSQGITGPRRGIPPTLLKELGNLELIARTAVDGVLHGAHTTDRPGFSQEFAEYRDYVPGDDLRFVDWNAYARTDRLYLKRFEGETNTRLLVVLDVSASMDATSEPSAGEREGLAPRESEPSAGERPRRGAAGRGSAPRKRETSKLVYATWLAAALVHIALRQHDAAGLLTFNDRVRDHLSPQAGRAQQRVLFHRLDALSAGGGSDWANAFAHVARRLTKRGVVAAISDFYCEPADFGRALTMMGARGHDLIVFHLLDGSERKPRFRRNVSLRDAETGSVIEVDVNDLRQRYPHRLADHESALRGHAGAAGAHYVRMTADEPLDRALIRYLRFRARHP